MTRRKERKIRQVWFRKSPQKAALISYYAGVMNKPASWVENEIREVFNVASGKSASEDGVMTSIRKDDIHVRS